jgi:hypothetical protein
MRNMKHIVLAVCLFCSLVVAAKDHKWQDATVLKLTTTEGGTVAVVVPMGNGIAGAAERQTASFYWIKGEKITYVIHNYSEGALIKPWLILTVGGPTKVAPDGKNLYVIDTEGKERKCRILGQIANEPTAK